MSLFLLPPVFNSNSNWNQLFFLTLTQDELRCSLNQLCPNISIVCCPNPQVTPLPLKKNGGLTLPLHPQCTKHNPFANTFQGSEDQQMMLLVYQVYTKVYKELKIWVLNPSWSSVSPGINRLHASRGLRCQDYIAWNPHELHKTHL